MDCFVTAEDETDLTAPQILDVCSARALGDVVLPHCVPPSNQTTPER